MSKEPKVLSIEDVDTDFETVKPEGEELITRDEIEDTPFVIIGTKGEYFGAMGQYRITEPKEDPDEIRKELEAFSWNRVIQVMMILSEKELVRLKDEIVE